VRHVVGWDVAVLLQDAGKLALQLAHRAAAAGRTRALGRPCSRTPPPCSSAPWGTCGPPRDVRGAPTTDPDLVFAAQGLEDLAQAAAGAIVACQEKGLPGEVELGIQVAELQGRLSAHSVVLKQAETTVGPAALASVLQGARGESERLLRRPGRRGAPIAGRWRERTGPQP